MKHLLTIRHHGDAPGICVSNGSGDGAGDGYGFGNGSGKGSGDGI